MSERGEHTLAEILSQPIVWADALSKFQAQAHELGQLWEQHAVDRVIFTGCGSTFYLSLTAAALFQALTGIPAQARPASELVLFPEIVFPPKQHALLVAISRSGETTETVEAIPIFRQHTGGTVITITCDSASSLADLSDLVLAVDTAQEHSVAQTRSFSSMLLLAQALAAHLGGQDVGALALLPENLQGLLKAYHGLARQLGEDDTIQRYFFLGSGFLYGVACEVMLKMKEMSLSYSETFHVLEFRHGPMSMVDERSLVVAMVSKQAVGQELAVLRQMSDLGGRALAVGQVPSGSVETWGRVIPLDAGTPPWASPVLHLPVLQLMAFYRSMSKGLNPDRPTNLDAVVHLGSWKANNG